MAATRLRRLDLADMPPAFNCRERAVGRAGLATLGLLGRGLLEFALGILLLLEARVGLQVLDARNVLGAHVPMPFAGADRYNHNRRRRRFPRACWFERTPVRLPRKSRTTAMKP